MSTATLTPESQPRTGLARIDEACRYLAVSRAHIYTLMEFGTLKFVKIGNCRRIPWAALAALAESGTTPS